MLELPHPHFQNAQCGHPKHYLRYNQYEEEIDKSKLIILGLYENISKYKAFMYLTGDFFCYAITLPSSWKLSVN